jgi:hypothetical protein
MFYMSFLMRYQIYLVVLEYTAGGRENRHDD